MNDTLACRKWGKQALVAATIIQKSNDKKMETPIQQLIRTLNGLSEPRVSDSLEIEEYKGGLRVAAVYAKLMLEKEKEAIQQAFYEGMLCQGFDPNMGRAEIYYNEVYKDND
jgi:hypothetical protein